MGTQSQAGWLSFWVVAGQTPSWPHSHLSPSPLQAS